VYTVFDEGEYTFNWLVYFPDFFDSDEDAADDERNYVTILTAAAQNKCMFYRDIYGDLPENNLNWSDHTIALDYTLGDGDLDLDYYLTSNWDAYKSTALLQFDTASTEAGVACPGRAFEMIELVYGSEDDQLFAGWTFDEDTDNTHIVEFADNRLVLNFAESWQVGSWTVKVKYSAPEGVMYSAEES
jgi:hypothetical protein